MSDSHVIPAAAVEAANDAMQKFALANAPSGQSWDAYARAALEAAAPHMLALAFDEGVDAGMAGWNSYKEREEIDNPYH